MRDQLLEKEKKKLCGLLAMPADHSSIYGDPCVDILKVQGCCEIPEDLIITCVDRVATQLLAAILGAIVEPTSCSPQAKPATYVQAR